MSRKPRRPTPADRAARDLLLGLVDDPTAHGQHRPTSHGRVACGRRQYKDGFAPCQLTVAWDTRNLVRAS